MHDSHFISGKNDQLLINKSVPPHSPVNFLPYTVHTPLSGSRANPDHHCIPSINGVYYIKGDISGFTMKTLLLFTLLSITLPIINRAFPVQTVSDITSSLETANYHGSSLRNFLPRETGTGDVIPCGDAVPGRNSTIAQPRRNNIEPWKQTRISDHLHFRMPARQYSRLISAQRSFRISYLTTVSFPLRV
ncbi:MAG: hypothetical protein JW863_09870 [Chitinispirillaceae bacterium]|nr:hypothetical protein [Chitinispirillaceae bacterium]